METYSKSKYVLIVTQLSLFRFTCQNNDDVKEYVAFLFLYCIVIFIEYLMISKQHEKSTFDYDVHFASMGNRINETNLRKYKHRTLVF